PSPTRGEEKRVCRSLFATLSTSASGMPATPGGERDGVRGTGASLYGADLNPLTRRAPRGDLSPSGRGEEARLPLGFATGKQGQPLTSGQPPSFSGRKASAAGMVARTL